MYTAESFECLQRLIDVVGLGVDPSGWSISCVCFEPPTLFLAT